MLRIIADKNIPFLRGVLEPYADVQYLPGNLINRESVGEADALIIRTRTICDRFLLEESQVKFIGTATIGYDHIDTEYCKSKGITWINAPGCNSSSVQQYVSAALIVLSQKFNFRLSEKTLGIIGVGNVGSKVSTAAALLGMKVKLNDPPRAVREGNKGFTTLDEILETCDIITLHVPLTMEGEFRTFHLFDGPAIKKIKTGAILMNTSRGEVIETKALKKALSCGRIAGSVIDVWENEPGIDLELLRLASITTPHIAGYSADGKANGTAMVVKALSRHFNLPLTGFYPTGLIPPENPVIEADGNGQTGQQIIDDTVIHTYPIMSDHERLRQSPETFEVQRGNYPNRREFNAYTANVSSPNRDAGTILENLGFIVNIK